jgi:hypothetical protein
MRMIAEALRREPSFHFLWHGNRVAFWPFLPSRAKAMPSIYSKLMRPVNSSIVLLLLIGYVLMGWMMAEQNRTISAQRELIRKLFQDSVQLSGAQLRENRQHQVHRR